MRHCFQCRQHGFNPWSENPESCMVRPKIYIYETQDRPCVCAQSCPTLCNPMDCSPPGSSVRGIFQARIMKWVFISYSRGYFQLRDRTCIPCISWHRMPVPICFRLKWHPTPVLLPGESHGQRSLRDYSPRGRKEWDTTEAT